jgi:hypothetical protein
VLRLVDRGSTGYSPSYVQNLKNLGENIKRPHRSREVQFSQHFLVEKLSSKEQVIWLAKSAEGKWSNRELRQAIQQAHSPTVAEGQAETLHTVDVTVEMTVEASTAYAGEQEAWELVKAAIKRDEQDGLMPKANRARVIASRARPK